MARLMLKRKTKKVPYAPYPLTIEMRYAAILKRIPAKMEREALAALAELGPQMVELVAREKTVRTDAEILTGWAAVLARFIMRITDAITGTLTEGLEAVGRIGAEVNRASRVAWSRQIRAAYGVDILRGEPQLAPLFAAWEQENLALIKSIPETIVTQLRSEMTRGLLEGKSVKDLSALVRERTGVGKSRSELIARDQIGKLNGQLAEYRQRGIGIKEYIWRTSQDERVRPTHRVRNGKTYKWSDAGIRPGSEVRCRCNAEPVFPEEFGTETPDDG